MAISKRDAIKAQRTKKKRQQRRNTILGAIGIILLLIILFASPTIINAVKPAGAFVKITPVAYAMEDGKAIGNPNAKVIIEVYEDFQCPSCKEYSASDEKQLLASSYITSGQVYYVFRHLLIIDAQSVTKESHQAANASMCALEQGRFWDYHDMLFANQGVTENGGSFNDKRLQAFADSLGLDMVAFNKCFSANKYSADIEADIKKGESAGFHSTPTIIINGVSKFPTFVPSYEELKAAIDAALAASGG